MRSLPRWLRNVRVPNVPTGLHNARVLCIAAVMIAAMATIVACGEPDVPPALPQVGSTPTVRTSDLRAGGATTDSAVRNPYADDPRALRDGKARYMAMNCNACHGEYGGGAIGPPLSDDAWVYGGAAENIVQSIIQGRPNGMPSYGGKLPESEMWQIALYVQSLATHAANSKP